MDEVPEFWLKAVGTVEDPVADEWLLNASDRKLIERVGFPGHVQPSISPGDLMVLYAAGKQVVFGVVEAKTFATMDQHRYEARWPRIIRVKPVLLVGDLREAPHFSRLGIDGKSLRSKSHVRLTPMQYRKAVAAMADVAGFDDEQFVAAIAA